MISCCRSLKHLKIHTLDHGALVFRQASEEKATRYGLWCLPNMPEWSKQSFSSYAETDRSRLACTPIYAITNRKDDIYFRIRWTPTQTFWKRIRSVLHGIAPSTLTAQLLTREKASVRNSKTLRSHAVNYKEECFICGKARTTNSDRSLLMISTFDK